MEGLTTRDLLDAWRDASRAAELAERLAEAAAQAAEVAEAGASAAEEIADLAEAAASSAEHAAQAARAAAVKARGLASGSRDVDLTTAESAAEMAREVETAARDRYQRAVAEAGVRHNGTDGVASRNGTGPAVTAD